MLHEKARQGGSILLAVRHVRWTNHQIMNNWFARHFKYLDRYHVRHYNLAECLIPSTEENLIKVVEVEILEKVATEFLENEESGCRALVDSGNSEDLHIMFRMLSRLGNGSYNPMASVVEDGTLSPNLTIISISVVN